MRSDIDVSDGLLDFGHVTGNALAARAAGGVVGMLFEGGRMWAVLGVRSVTGRANLLGRLDQHRIVVGAMGIVAAETSDAAGVHQALHEIIALHAILVCRAVGKMGERHLAELVIFELPEVNELAAHVKAHRPIVVLALDRVAPGLTLRMALNEGIAGIHEPQLRRIDDVEFSRVFDVLAARSVAALATDVPLRDFLRVDVVIHRVATIAQWSGGALHVVGRVERRPPVRSVLYEVRPPQAVDDIPLRRKDKVIIADPFEVALLPFAAVGEGDIAATRGRWRRYALTCQSFRSGSVQAGMPVCRIPFLR